MDEHFNYNPIGPYGGVYYLYLSEQGKIYLNYEKYTYFTLIANSLIRYMPLIQDSGIDHKYESDPFSSLPQNLFL